MAYLFHQCIGSAHLYYNVSLTVCLSPLLWVWLAIDQMPWQPVQAVVECHHLG